MMEEQLIGCNIDNFLLERVYMLYIYLKVTMSRLLKDSLRNDVLLVWQLKKY